VGYSSHRKLGAEHGDYLKRRSMQEIIHVSVNPDKALPWQGIQVMLGPEEKKLYSSNLHCMHERQQGEER